MNTNNDSQVGTLSDPEKIAKSIANLSDEMIFEFYYSDNSAKDISKFNSIDDLRNELIKGTKNNENINSSINTNLINSLKSKTISVYEKHKNNHRILIFIINYIFNANPHFLSGYISYSVYLPSGANPYLLLLKIFNDIYSKDNNPNEINLIINRYMHISNHYKLKKYLDDKAFTEWLKQYFFKNSIDERRFSHYSNDQHTEDYVLSVLDDKLMKNESDYIILINRIKNSWQQKNYLEKEKAKKKYHLPLTKKTKSELTQLSEIRNCSEAKVLEDLIKNAYKLEYCDENGKPKY